MRYTPATPGELIRVDEILDQMAKDFEIEYQIKSGEFDREEAMTHFRQREALSIVRTMVLDKSAKIAKI